MPCRRLSEVVLTHAEMVQATQNYLRDVLFAGVSCPEVVLVRRRGEDDAKFTLMCADVKPLIAQAAPVIADVRQIVADLKSISPAATTSGQV